MIIYGSEQVPKNIRGVIPHDPRVKTLAKITEPDKNSEIRDLGHERPVEISFTIDLASG